MTDRADPPDRPARTAKLDRRTGETQVHVALELDGAGTSDAATGHAFLDHMLDTLARYAGWSLTVQAEGDMAHHLVEDVAITLGRALREALGEAPAVARFGERTVPMDDALVLVAVDLVERPYYEGDVPKRHFDHFLRSLATEGRFTLHVRTLRGRDEHHVTEAAYKGLGLALGQAQVPAGEHLSTKGPVETGGEAGPGGDAGAGGAAGAEAPEGGGG